MQELAPSSGCLWIFDFICSLIRPRNVPAVVLTMPLIVTRPLHTFKLSICFANMIYWWSMPMNMNTVILYIFGGYPHFLHQYHSCWKNRNASRSKGTGENIARLCSSWRDILNLWTKWISLCVWTYDVCVDIFYISRHFSERKCSRRSLIDKTLYFA